MKIIIRIGDPLAGHIGRRKLELVLDKDRPTVADALEALAMIVPEMEDELSPDGLSQQMRLPYHLFLNHKMVPWEKIASTCLADGDRLALFLTVIGG